VRLRFEGDFVPRRPLAPVAFIYETQVEGAAQGRGVGRFLMQAVELAARQGGLATTPRPRARVRARREQLGRARGRGVRDRQQAPATAAGAVRAAAGAAAAAALAAPRAGA
jgi:GNAT superfamily N-acetyltransferase